MNQENKVETDDSIDQTVLSLIQTSQDEAGKWIERGYNIIHFTAEDNIEIREQLRAVLSKHFEKLLENE